MLKFAYRKPSEVPSYTHTNPDVIELQKTYDGYISAMIPSAKNMVGVLELDTSESTRSVKIRVRRAATRKGVNVKVWGYKREVFFQVEPRRGRRRNQSTD